MYKREEPRELTTSVYGVPHLFPRRRLARATLEGYRDNKSSLQALRGGKVDAAAVGWVWPGFCTLHTR